MHTVTAADYAYRTIADTTAGIPDFGAAVEALRAARPDSVTFMLSVVHTNFLSLGCANAVAAEFRDAGFEAAADAIDRAVMQCEAAIEKFIPGTIILSPAPLGEGHDR